MKSLKFGIIWNDLDGKRGIIGPFGNEREAVYWMQTYKWAEFCKCCIVPMMRPIIERMVEDSPHHQYSIGGGNGRDA